MLAVVVPVLFAAVAAELVRELDQEDAVEVLRSFSSLWIFFPTSKGS